MSQATESCRKRCDCALVFDDVQSLGTHIRETGHMKGKWCTQCSRLFITKSAFTQHKKKSAKHQSNATSTTAATTTATTTTSASTSATTSATATTAATSKPNPSDKKARIERPSVVASKSTGKSTGKFLGKSISKSVATTTSPPNTSQTVKGKKIPKGPRAIIPSGSQAMQNPKAVNPATPKLASTMPSDPLTSKYPWSSGKQAPGLVNSLSSCCHNQACLIAENYYTGIPTEKKWKHINIRCFLPTPAKMKGVPRRKALVIDCEMVGVSGGRSELARICIVDLFTREVLVDSLVLPTEIVRDWRTKYSGITPAMMAQARANNTALNGWPTARAKLFELADANTILIGHSLNNDLHAIHVTHSRIVDSAILASEAVFGKGNKLGRKWSLKSLSEELLGIKIQSSKGGHDCLEDTLASREIVLWCFREREKLATWAKDALAKYEIEKQKREERQRVKAQEMALKKQKEREKEREKNKKVRDLEDDYDDDLVMSWEEYLEACHYPPGYDPMWSD
ncbi:ribonuclease H-like domain-containing protein [Daldinia eschscholtzii]|nr:ribonuclease H-like domain-containing protein [Daldinia eschscholtzii]